MLKEEFMNRIHKIAPGCLGQCIILDEISKQPNVMGCYKEGEFWKVYPTNNVGISSLYIDTYYEEEAFDVLHRMFERKIKLSK